MKDFCRQGFGSACLFANNYIRGANYYNPIDFVQNIWNNGEKIVEIAANIDLLV